jgi:hypothetical protein
MSVQLALRFDEVPITCDAPDRDIGYTYDGSAGSGGKLVKGWRGVKISMNEDNPRCS